MIILAQMMWVVSETISAAIYNGRGGADVVSGMAASFTIANLLFVSFAGITTSTGVIIGKSLGSNQLNRARQEKSMDVVGSNSIRMFYVPYRFWYSCTCADSIRQIKPGCYRIYAKEC